MGRYRREDIPHIARHFLAEFVSGFASSPVVADLSLLTTAVLAALLIWGAVAAATSDA